MPVRCTPDAYGNNYIFSLTGLDESGNEVTVGLNPVDNKGTKSIHAVRYSGYPTGTLRGDTGDGEYSHKRKPYGGVSRRDWSGGLGSLNGLTDATKYWFGKRIWSVVPERMMLSPKLYRANIGTPARLGNEATINHPTTWVTVPAGTRYTWQVTTTVATNGVNVLLRVLGINPITLRIRLDNAGSPGDIMDEVEATDVFIGSHRYQFEVDIDAGTYWIEIIAASSFEIGTASQTSYTVKSSTDGETWDSSVWSPPVFFMMSDTGADEWIFFNYRWGTYAVSGQKLYVNGDRGACDDNSSNLNTLVDATKTWTVNEWAGAIVKVNQGPSGWRKIVSNTATTLTVDRPYTTAHSATGTWYVILGASKWTEITGHGFTANVTDAETVREETVYFAMGPDQQCRRMREYNNSGTWTREFDEDTQPTAGVLPGANFLCSVFDQIDGPVLYKVVNGDQGYIAKAPAVAWGTDLTFGTEIKVASDNWEDLSGAVEYDGKMAVTAMDSLWMIQNGYAEKVSIDMQSQWTGYTGRRPTVVPPYLVFPFGNRIQRMYQSIVESFGPERDSALPKRYDGQVMDNLSIVGGLVICKDGGKLGVYASDAEGGSFLYRDGGWHPLAFTGLGSAMRGLWYQRREDEMDMMWFGDHNGLWYMYIPRGWDYTKDPMYNQSNRIEDDGWFITGWFDTGQLLPAKWWDYVTVFADNLSSAYGRKVRLYYQVSDGVEFEAENVASDWYFAEEITGGYNNTITLDKQGRRIRFLILLMGDGDSTPIMHGYTCDYISKDDDAESWQMAISLKDFSYNKSGEPDDIVTVKEKSDIINYWARTVRPLTLNCEWPLWDDREAQILRPGLVPLESAPEGLENMYASLTVLGMEEPVEEPPEDTANCPLTAPETGPYTVPMVGTVSTDGPTKIKGLAIYTIRTPQHSYLTRYTLNGLWSAFTGTWAETSEDDFYHVYARDAKGVLVAEGVHDAVDPQNLGVRTGILTATDPAKIATLEIEVDPPTTAPSRWEFVLDEEGWVFTNSDMLTGGWTAGKIWMKATDGWDGGYWRYTYATDVYLQNRAKVEFDFANQATNYNYFVKFDVNVTLVSGRTTTMRYNDILYTGHYVFSLPQTVNVGFGDETTAGAKVNYIAWVADLGIHTTAGTLTLDNVKFTYDRATKKIDLTSAALRNVCP